MLARGNLARYWAALFLSLMGLVALVYGSAPAHAAAYDSGPVVTIQFEAHLKNSTFWLNYVPPKSRYFATLDACVDPLFVTIPSGAHDFGNCFVLQGAKPDYTPINLPADNEYIRENDIAYWTRPVQVIMPDQFAHTIDLTMEYVFHDRGAQTTPGTAPVVLAHSVLSTVEITISASDGVVEVPMVSAIPFSQRLHFVFHPVVPYDQTLTFWGCLRRPAQGVPSAYCTQLTRLSETTYQADVKIPEKLDPINLFSPDINPLLIGTNIQMTIVAAPPGPVLPDGAPAPLQFPGHPANQIVTPADSLFDCAMNSTLAFADQTIDCTASINHDTLGQAYLSPTKVNAYIGSPPSAAQNSCVVCSNTRPVPYAGPLLLALFLMLLGAGGIVTLIYMGRVPLPAASGRGLMRQPMFVSTSVLALVSLVFLVGLAVQFHSGSQPAVPGKLIFQLTPGASPVANDVPPTPTATPSPTPTPGPSPSPTVSPNPSPSPTP
jgi:hypothetical protein